MYTRFHSAVGGLICCAFPNYYGIGAAFLSHLVADIPAEYQYNTKEEMYLYEAISHGIMIFGAYLNQNTLWIIAGIFVANAIDLIDQPLIRLLKKKPIFPCHKSYWMQLWMDYKDTRTFENIIIFIFLACMFIKG